MYAAEMLCAKYDLITAPDMPLSVLRSAYRVIRKTAQALHGWYLESGLYTFTCTDNPALYPRSVTSRALFRLVVGELRISTEHGLLEQIGERIDQTSGGYGSNGLKKLNIAESWPSLFVAWVQGTLTPERRQQMNALLYVQMAAVLATSSVPETPEGRLAASIHYFSTDGFGFGFATQANLPNPLGYGRSQIDFTKWEIERNVLNLPNAPQNPGSRWWRAVNGRLMCDMEEARLIHAARLDSYGGTSVSVDHWLDYLNHPTAQSWYLAHDFSIVKGYLDHEPLAEQEIFAERVLLVDVLTRLLYAQQLITSLTDHLLGTSPLAEVIELFRQQISLPQDGSVKMIVDIATIYPHDYVLLEADQDHVLLIHLLERMAFGRNNIIPYAGITESTLSKDLQQHFQKDVERIARELLRTYPTLPAVDVLAIALRTQLTVAPQYGLWSVILDFVRLLWQFLVKRFGR